MKRYWQGEPPANCDICKGAITSTFVDGATRMGPWANMCNTCFGKYGVGIGQGRGQSYELVSGKWEKVAG